MNRRIDPGPLIIICKSEGSKQEKWDVPNSTHSLSSRAYRILILVQSLAALMKSNAPFGDSVLSLRFRVRNRRRKLGRISLSKQIIEERR